MYPLDYQLKSGEKYKQRVSLKLKKDKYSAFLRLIPMRIRFRAYFGRVAKLNIVCAKRTSLCEIGCRDGTRVIRWFTRVIQHLGFWTWKSQANVDYRYVWRRAECTSLDPGLKHPSLR